MTIDTLKSNGANSLWFKNSSFFGDQRYEFNERKMELTVYMKVDGFKRQATYKVEENGKIGNVLFH